MLPNTGKDKTANVLLTRSLHQPPCRKNFLLTQIRLLGKLMKSLFSQQVGLSLGSAPYTRMSESRRRKSIPTCFFLFFSFSSDTLSQIKQKKKRKKREQPGATALLFSFSSSLLVMLHPLSCSEMASRSGWVSAAWASDWSGMETDTVGIASEGCIWPFSALPPGKSLRDFT